MKINWTSTQEAFTMLEYTLRTFERYNFAKGYMPIYQTSPLSYGKLLEGAKALFQTNTFRLK